MSVRWGIAACTAGAAALGSIAFPPTLALIWNTSASVPVGLYGVHEIEGLEVGDLVAVSPPEPLAQFLNRRGYLPLGVPMLKRVAGLPGQAICRTGISISVDGVLFGAAIERDRSGRPMPVWQGCRRISRDEIFLMNFGVPDSFDGRYFGGLPQSAVIGRAVPLLVDEEGNGRFVWRPSSQ